MCEISNTPTDDILLHDILSKCHTIAIVGCSPDSSKDSHKVAAYLQEHGYKIVPIYPKEDMILGQKVYRSLTDIPFGIDLVDIFRKSKVIDDVVDECITRGDIYAVWSQIGLVNNLAMAKAKKNNIKTVQNLCTKLEHKRLL